MESDGGQAQAPVAPVQTPEQKMAREKQWMEEQSSRTRAADFEPAPSVDPGLEVLPKTSRAKEGKARRSLLSAYDTEGNLRDSDDSDRDPNYTPQGDSGESGGSHKISGVSPMAQSSGEKPQESGSHKSPPEPTKKGTFGAHLRAFCGLVLHSGVTKYFPLASFRKEKGEKKEKASTASSIGR